MKVAVLTSFPSNPLAPSGGVEAVSVNLVGALSRRPGLDVHVLTADRRCEAPSEQAWDGATIHRLPMGSGKLLNYVIGAGRVQMAGCLKRLAPDVIHTHDFYGMMVPGIATPRVFTVHGFIHEDTRYSGGALAWLRARVWRHYELAGWRGQPHIISISPYVRERLRPLVSGSLHDIENPIAPEAFEIRPDERAGTIFSAAAISPRKNTLGLVRAFARVRQECPGAMLRLAGPEPDGRYAEEVRRVSRELGLEAAVQWLGSLAAAGVREELAHASIFVLPSFEEGAPMGVAEALAAGVPVVTSNRCGMPFMVEQGRSGFLIEPEDEEEIAGRSLELLADHGLRQRMGMVGRQFALERFHPDRVAERTEEVYRLAMEEPAAAPLGAVSTGSYSWKDTRA